MPNGGQRPGAGRPRKAEKFARPIAGAEKRIADRLPWLIDKDFELAEGVLIRQETKDGPRIYSQPPDRQAIEYLLNRIMGKPTERQERDYTGDLTINVKYADLDADPDASETSPGTTSPDL